MKTLRLILGSLLVAAACADDTPGDTGATGGATGDDDGGSADDGDAGSADDGPTGGGDDGGSADDGPDDGGSSDDVATGSSDDAATGSGDDAATGSGDDAGSGSGSGDASGSGDDGSGSGTGLACEPITDDPSAIGQDCSEGGKMCPEGYTCQDINGIVLQQLCEILCKEDCDCPDGYTCEFFEDKAASWYQCSGVG